LNKRNFTGFDIVRTVLAISVALGHFYYWNGVNTHFPRSFFVAVDFFFVLSGFVITQSVLNSKSLNIDSFLSRFVVGRIARLFPLYIFVFVISIIMLFITHKLKIDAFFYYFISFFLLQSIGLDSGAREIFSDTPIGIGWSLSVEFWIGILFFSLVFILRYRIVLLAYTCLALSFLGLVLIFNFSPSMDVNFQKLFGFVSFGSIRGTIGFSCGTVSYIVYSKFNLGVLSRKLIGILEVFTMVLIIFFIYMSEDKNNLFIAPFLGGIFLFLIATESGLIGKLLTINFFDNFRRISYSVYLIHPILVFFWRYYNIPFTHQLSLIYIIMVYVLATITYKFIERPSMRIIKGKYMKN
jgi:peptidoglycan/LPS O-acetylase OafA/YrhL